VKEDLSNVNVKPNI